MIKRLEVLERIKSAFRVMPVVGLLGPRQCGKTTLAKQYAGWFKQKSSGAAVVHYDLENPRDLAALENPLLALEDQKGLVIIDEIQRRPELFPILRYLVDQQQQKTRYLILGSASRDLLRQSSESLAGRLQTYELTPFSLLEVPDEKKLWLRGGFPRSYLGRSLADSVLWREAYITSYFERDLPALGIRIPAPQLRRFWQMLAHYHGQIWNGAEIGNSLALSAHTVKSYLDIVTETFMVRQLQPWYENISKRQVKSPKIYFRDAGIFHALLGIDDLHQLRRHPKLGASWEGFALESVLQASGLPPQDCYYWATHNGAELDLLMVRGARRLGFEFKYNDQPQITRSMRIAITDLGLEQLTIIVPGTHHYLLEPGIEVFGLQRWVEASGSRLPAAT